MDRIGKLICQMAVLSLAVVAIWPSKAQAATAPVLKPLGQITEGIIAPTRLDVDNDGVLYVCDPRRNAVLRYDKYGRALTALAGAYRVGGTGVAVTPDGKTVYVSVASAVDARGTKIVTGVAMVDGKSGALLGYLGDKGLTEFQEAGEIDLDAQGMVYVADDISRFVRVYNPTTKKLLYQFGGPGTGNGQFWTIRSLTVDPAAQEVYVVDPSTNNGTSRIQVFSLSGQYKRLIAQTGLGTPTLAFPQGMAFDNFGRGYLLEGFYSELRTFGVPGTYLSKYGTAGYALGQLSRPFDAAYDIGTKRLFIGCDGGRVEVLGVDGGSTPLKANTAPGLVEALSPVNGSEVASSTPQLMWKNAADAEGDVLTYAVKVLRDGQVVVQSQGVASGASSSSVQVSVALAENQLHSWQVQANDGVDVSAWSAPQGFWVNAVEEAPTAPMLIAPIAGVSLDGSAVFSWQASSDVDPFDSISYRLEISADPAFTAPTIKVETSTTATAALGELAGYENLVDGSTYYWRTVAVDSHGIVSAGAEIRPFIYDTTILKVTANMPGARVYAGGSYAYSGQYLGNAPLELRDVPVGLTSIVIERSGFEPWIGQATVSERANVTVVGLLVPAVQPVGHKARPLSAGGSKILAGAEVVPVAIDYDNDGLIDLLTADAAGTLTLYPGVTGDAPSFAAGVGLGVALPAGAAPCVADWNNDGKKDLLVGTAGGSVLLYLNVGTESAPAYDVGNYLIADGAPVSIGNSAVPAVFDYNNDDKKDLIVGTGGGQVLKFQNVGTDATPELSAAGTLVPSLSGNAAPFVTDWNSDGNKDLLLATSQHLFVYLRQADGGYAPLNVLTVEEDLVGKKGNANSGSGYLGDRLRIYSYDVDGKKGKDLIVGNAVGEVRLAASFGKAPVAAYGPALLAKVEEITDLAAKEGLDLVNGLAEVQALIDTTRYPQAKARVLVLQANVPTGSGVAAALGELAGVL